jgi:hypothetical protein
MKKLLLVGFGLLFLCSAFCQLTPKQLTAANKQTIGFLEFLPPDYGSQKHPLIIYLHGIGERGYEAGGTTAKTAIGVQANEIPKLLANGATMKFIVNCKPYSFVVLAPQLLSTYGSWQNFYVDEMIRYAKANLNIDTNRVYLTGISLGGGGTWKYATASLANAQSLAAIAPVCGTCEWSNVCNTIVAANLPVWAFHARDDGVVGVGCTDGAISSLLACNPSVKPIATIYPNGNHWIWSRSYALDNSFHSPNLFEWFLTHERKPAAQPAPSLPSTFFADAGPDQTITATTTVLNASASKGYKSAWAVYWDLVEYPAAGTWNVFPKFQKIGLQVNVENLVRGTYKFRVTVENEKGEKASDDVIINIK